MEQLNAKKGTLAQTPPALIGDFNRENGNEDADEVSRKGTHQRGKAITKWSEWHPSLGIELDPDQDEPVVLRVWPVAAFSHETISEVEEEVARR